MKALVYYGPGDVRLCERPIPTPGENEVLIKLRAAAVCGSDLGAYRLPAVSDRWKPPIVLGHEFSGEIAACGKNATRYPVGTRVTANPILCCGDCFYCARGEINLCQNRSSLGTSIGGTRTDGALQEYFTLREEALIPLDDRVSDRAGALLEPLAVCYSAARAGNPAEGERVVVMGAGPIGLMTVKCLKAAQAGAIIVSDIVEEKLIDARNYGASAAINVKHESLKDAVLAATGGVGADRVVICTGTKHAIAEAFALVRNGGSIVLVALVHHPVEIDPMQLVARGVSLIGSYMFTTEQKDVMQLLAEGQLQVDDIITSTCTLEQSGGLFERLTSPDCTDVKVLVTAK